MRKETCRPTFRMLHAKASLRHQETHNPMSPGGNLVLSGQRCRPDNHGDNSPEVCHQTCVSQFLLVAPPCVHKTQYVQQSTTAWCGFKCFSATPIDLKYSFMFFPIQKWRYLGGEWCELICAAIGEMCALLFPFYWTLPTLRGSLCEHQPDREASRY